MDQAEYSVPIPSALLDAIADRVAERLTDRLGEPSSSGAAWMRTKDAADYLVSRPVEKWATRAG